MPKTKANKSTIYDKQVMSVQQAREKAAQAIARNRELRQALQPLVERILPYLYPLEPAYVGTLLDFGITLTPVELDQLHEIFSKEGMPAYCFFDEPHDNVYTAVHISRVLSVDPHVAHTLYNGEIRTGRLQLWECKPFRTCYLVDTQRIRPLAEI